VIINIQFLLLTSYHCSMYLLLYLSYWIFILDFYSQFWQPEDKLCHSDAVVITVIFLTCCTVPIIVPFAVYLSLSCKQLFVLAKYLCNKENVEVSLIHVSCLIVCSDVSWHPTDSILWIIGRQRSGGSILSCVVCSATKAALCCRSGRSADVASISAALISPRSRILVAPVTCCASILSPLN